MFNFESLVMCLPQHAVENSVKVRMAVWLWGWHRFYVIDGENMATL